MKNIEKVFSYLQDSEMEELAKMVLKKLQDMTDEEFQNVAEVFESSEDYDLEVEESDEHYE